MYTSIDDAFNAMIEMAEDCNCVGKLGSNQPFEELDSANRFLVEGNDDGDYKVTVECNGVQCVAEKTNGNIEVTDGSEENFMAFCEEFTLAW